MANSYENSDALWLYEPLQPKYPYTTTTSPNAFEMYWPLRDTRAPSSGDKVSSGEKPKKEKKPKMSYRDEDHRSDQEKIDDAVREAIAKPRREKEIARRVAATTALTNVLEGAEVGTVVTFTRRVNKKTVHSYVATKTDDARNGSDAEPVWHITGSGGSQTGSYGYTFENFLQWATIGDYLIEDVKVASEFKPVEL